MQTVPQPSHNRLNTKSNFMTSTVKDVAMRLHDLWSCLQQKASEASLNSSNSTKDNSNNNNNSAVERKSLLVPLLVNPSCSQSLARSTLTTTPTIETWLPNIFVAFIDIRAKHNEVARAHRDTKKSISGWKLDWTLFKNASSHSQCGVDNCTVQSTPYSFVVRATSPRACWWHWN